MKTEMLHTFDKNGTGDGASRDVDLAAGGISQGRNASPASELEDRLAHQDQLLNTAAQFLQEAAYLARYHQPALERHIRAFLVELEA